MLFVLALSYDIMYSSSRKVMGTVNFDFTGTESNQITISAGQTIEIVEQGDPGGWSQAIDLSGKTGYYPTDYVVKIEAAVTSTGNSFGGGASSGNSFGSSSMSSTPMLSTTATSQVVAGNSFSSAGNSFSSSVEPTPTSSEEIQAKALYDYTAADDPFNTFSVGDILSITQRGEPGAWSASTMGPFPTDYVEFLLPKPKPQPPAGNGGGGLGFIPPPPPKRKEPLSLSSGSGSSSNDTSDPFSSITSSSSTVASLTQPETVTSNTPVKDSNPFGSSTSTPEVKTVAVTPVSKPKPSVYTGAPSASSVPETQPPTRRRGSTITVAQDQIYESTKDATVRKELSRSSNAGGIIDTISLGKVPTGFKPFSIAPPAPTDGTPPSPGHAIWRQYLFFDVFTDCHVQKIADPVANANNKFALTRITESFRFIQTVVGRLAPDLDRFLPQSTEGNLATHVMSELVTALSATMDIVGRLPAYTNDHNKTFAFLCTFSARIRNLAVGQYMMIPIVWANTSRSPSAKGGDHAIIMLIKRISGNQETDFIVTVINTDVDEGLLDYHAMQGDESDASLLYNMSFIIPNVSNAKVHNTTFWFLVFMSAINPSTTRAKRFFYERILPFLSEAPIKKVFAREKADFILPPIGGDSTFVNCVLEAVRMMVRLEGFSYMQSKNFPFFIRGKIMEMVRHDLSVVESLAPGEIDLLRIAYQTISIEAGHQAEENVGASLVTVDYLFHLKTVLHDVSARLDLLDQGRLAPIPSCSFTKPLQLSKGTMEWSSFGRICRDTSVEHLAGNAPVPPILRPIELTRMKDRVDSFSDATAAMRHCVELCLLLSNQRAQVKNSYTIRTCLIEHLFIRVLPLPLAFNNPDRDEHCFWHGQEIRNETQVDVLKLLHMLARHFATASLSVMYSRSGDAIRILTISCMAAICDAVMRKIACDIPSATSLHYSGKTAGPVHPFGFNMGKFAYESEYLQFTTPETVSARTQVLDYFNDMTKIVRRDHVMFDFDRSNAVGRGEKRFFHQLCLHWGFDMQNLDLYISGENPEVYDNYPELSYFRDLIFTFKLVMVPSSDSLPELYPWEPRDAALTWKIENKKSDDENMDVHHSSNEYVVTGFKRRLECVYPEEVEEDKFGQPLHNKRGFINRFKQFMGLHSKPRSSPSSANPSFLVGERVDTEDDILFVKNLPDFDETMGASDCELMLQYLTAPYIRVPLLLNFFSNEKRLKSLRLVELQEVVDAALFEPGRWQELADADLLPIDVIPAPGRDHLSTKVGLLFNEIIQAPNIILSSIHTMLDRVADMDSGRYGATSESILYVLRLALRVEGYLLFLVKNHNFNKKKALDASKSERGEWFSGAYTEAYVRGLQCSDHIIGEALACQKNIRDLIESKIFRIVARWIKRAKNDGKMLLACKLHAHLALVYKNVEPDELNARIIFTQLASQIFVGNNYKHQLDVNFASYYKGGLGAVSRKDLNKINDDNKDYDLGVAQIDLFDMYQRNRGMMLEWLIANPEQRNQVIDAVVQLVEEGKSRKKGGDQYQMRNWVAISRPGFAGKFVPDNEVPDFESGISELAKREYEAWLRETTTVVIDTEMNTQRGEFTIKKHEINPLPEDIAHDISFQTVFKDIHCEANDADDQHMHKVGTADIIQCAEVMNTTHRTWLRLIGLEYDVQKWTPDTRKFTLLKLYSYSVCQTSWIKNILDPWINNGVLAGLKLYVPGFDHSSDSMVKLYAFIPTGNDPEGEEETKSNLAKMKEAAFNAADAINPFVNVPGTLKEIFVYKHLKIFHVFNVISHGRRWYRTQVFTSDPVYTLHDLILNDGVYVDSVFAQSGGQVQGEATPSESLVINRLLNGSESQSGVFQTYMAW